MSLAIEKEQAMFKYPPIPREHGAYFMFYMPLVTVLIGLRVDWLLTLVLVLTVTGGFFGQYTASLMLRGRSGAGDGWWLIIYGCVFAMGTVYLLVYGLTDLFWIGIPFGLLMSWQLARSRFSRKRVDRTLSGEMMAIAGLALTAPAASVVGMGELTQTGIGLWGLFVLFFCSSVFYVKMRIEAVRIKAGVGWADRLRLGSGLLVYHAILLINLLTFVRLSEMGIFLLIGFIPVFI
ncbi:MAG: YwiC-like family protein, partial [Candidatus Latescibacteria bacterium]|nr:YwiC-like family protein [Candidatus Latescibacterota bacterium]